MTVVLEFSLYLDMPQWLAALDLVSHAQWQRWLESLAFHYSLNLH